MQPKHNLNNSSKQSQKNLIINLHINTKNLIVKL